MVSTKTFAIFNLKGTALPSRVTFDSETATSDSNIVSLFNSYFHSNFTPGPDLSQYQFSSEPSVILEDFDITVHDVFVRLTSLHLSIRLMELMAFLLLF